MKNEPVDLADLRQRLHYEPEDGTFTWKVDMARNVKAGRPAGTVARNGYLVIVFEKRHFGAHRLAWLMAHGSWPEGSIDHLNGNRLDNRLSNLRVVSSSQNARNRAMNPKTASGYRGVYRCRSKWKASIHIDGRNLVLGFFLTPQEASSAYLAARAIHYPTQPIPREFL